MYNRAMIRLSKTQSHSFSDNNMSLNRFKIICLLMLALSIVSTGCVQFSENKAMILKELTAKGCSEAISKSTGFSSSLLPVSPLRFLYGGSTTNMWTILKKKRTEMVIGYCIILHNDNLEMIISNTFTTLDKNKLPPPEVIKQEQEKLLDGSFESNLILKELTATRCSEYLSYSEEYSMSPEKLALCRELHTDDSYEVGDTFRDCETCLEMVVVPSGSFMMGSPADEPHRRAEEGPQHQVTISKPFAVGKYEVTVGQYEKFVNDFAELVNQTDIKTKYPTNEWRDPGFEQSTNHPVVNVSWEDAQAYVYWLSISTGKNYRLLSEAEWEYVARAGTTTAYHFGADITHEQANYGRASQGTVEVGSYSENKFGLHDVHGNVWEWVKDCWYDNYNDAPSDGNDTPSDGSEWDCLADQVLRGGSWYDIPWNLRSAFRVGYSAGGRLNDVGFRIARTLTP